MELCEKCHNLICSCDSDYNREVLKNTEEMLKDPKAFNKFQKDVSDCIKEQQLDEAVTKLMEIAEPIITANTCELCNTTKGPLLSYNTMLMCDSCYKKEIEAEKRISRGSPGRPLILPDLTIEHKGAVIRIDHNSTDPNILMKEPLFKMKDGDRFEKSIEDMPVEPITDRPLTLPDDSGLLEPAHLSTDHYKIPTKIPMKEPGLEEFILRNKELKVDTTIKVKTDYFNAETKSIIDIEKEINADESIEIKDKPMELGRRILADFTHKRNVLFNFDQSYHKERDNKTSELRSYQTYLNDFANRVSKEERDRIGLKDLSYKPLPPKAPKIPRVKKKKFNKKELKEYSDKLGGNVEYLLQGLCVQKNITVEEAYLIVKKGMDKKG